MLFAALVSPAYDTVALFVTVGAAALPIATTSVMVLLVPAASAPALVHVTICPATEQFHPLPAAETNVRPLGNGSVTVIKAFVFVGPRLVTAMR